MGLSSNLPIKEESDDEQPPSIFENIEEMEMDNEEYGRKKSI